MSHKYRYKVREKIPFVEEFFFGGGDKARNFSEACFREVRGGDV